ncbi:MAG: class I SAM-dependent methyltransferase [Euryarchaeota archaeon]|nr:class I SAM-dependent methyltransferase [Euryarchaeota archaeon]MCG2734895.1 class I SAM-dependent methyltransferase [Candidatus Methanoperedenaceae archaeon]
MPKDKKSLILDFGCGTGILLKELSKKYDTVYGADINIQIAEQFLKNRGIGNVILFNNSDDKNYILPIKEKTLDVIICADVLEHVTNLDNILDKLIKLLNDDGLLIISGPTENILYKFGRTILRYKGDYHLRNIYDIRGIVSNNKKLEFVEKKAIFPIFNLFTIYVFKKINNIRGMRNE